MNGWEIISNNLLMTWEVIVLLLVLLGGFIFYAKDFKLGVTLHFLAFMCNFLAFWALNEYYGYGWNFSPSLVLAFVFLILMSFSLFAVGKTEPAGRFT